MSHTVAERALALAGIYQACSLVGSIAYQGTADIAAQEICIRSLFVTSPKDTADVFGGSNMIAENLRIGLDKMVEQFSETDKRDVELTRYVISVLALERKLGKNNAMLNNLSVGIDKARNQAEHFSPCHENVIANLADLYVNTISTLSPRIIVRGEHGHLANPLNASRVRALLLAAVRSAILWRQCGGNRWQLLFQRNNIVTAANNWRYEHGSRL
jgi:high frequency lysogenization protein